MNIKTLENITSSVLSFRQSGQVSNEYDINCLDADIVFVKTQNKNSVQFLIMVVIRAVLV